MGTGPADKLREIEQLRGQLDAKVAELERRLPPVAELGKRAVGLAVGGGAGGGVLWLAAKRLRKKKKSSGGSAPVMPTVVVHGLPKGMVPIVVGAVAVWAAVRLYELKQRQSAGGRTPAAVVTPMPERRAN